MILLELSANKPSFRTVKFKPQGMSLIVGKEANSHNSDSRKTYNGVGKSLIVRLIHFCLGSNKIDEFEKKIPDWTFNLKIKIENEELSIFRSTSKQSKIIVNDAEYGLRDFRKLLEDKVFDTPDNSPLSFRSLISRFIRPSKSSYNKAEIFREKESDFDRLLNNGFLLGLSTDLIIAKRDLKKEKDSIKQLKDNFDKDPILHDFYIGERDPDIELEDLEEKINRLDKSIKAFDVAEDYQKIREQADGASRDIAKIGNKEVVFKNALKNIEDSLKIKPDLPKEKVINIYDEAKLNLGDKVKKTLDEVMLFHEALLANRKKRLNEEYKKLESDLKALLVERQRLGKILDDSLKYLNSHRALDEFVGLSNKLKDMEIRARKIRDFKSLIRQYEAKIQGINRDLAQRNLDAQSYLESEEELIKRNVSIFRSLATVFYQDRASGISITNNDRENQIRFNIQSKIQDDASDGINEVKIFCFDITLLEATHNHKVKCIFHDSRLYSNMDPRQRETLFRVANDLSNKKGLQYIATVNQDELDSFKDRLTKEEYENIIEGNIQLELTDASAASKLLGINVDMDYGA